MTGTLSSKRDLALLYLKPPFIKVLITAIPQT